MKPGSAPGPVETGTVESLAFGGEGIVRRDKLVVFVPFAVPGDRIAYSITETKRSFARGKIEQILSPSPDRIPPPCPIYATCGGCQLQHVRYDAALGHKSAILEGLIRHHLHIDAIPMEPPLPSPLPYAYRNKMQLAAGRGKGGETLLGLYEPGSHAVADMAACLIQEETNNKLLLTFREGMRACGFEPYREREHAGLVRHFLARVNRQGEAYATVVATRGDLPGWEKLLAHIRRDVPSLQGFAVSVNEARANVVLGKKTIVLWGKDHLEESVGGFRFKIGPTTFFQVNTPVLERILERVVDWASPGPADAILDLYCGVGTFSIPLAKKSGRVVGVEENPEGVKWAGENALLNGARNATFVASPAETELEKLKPGAFQIAFLDPPRKGLSPAALQSLIRVKPNRILYLSCNPPTLVRDLKTLIDAGWTLKKIMAADFFPQTAQIEALALLHK